MKKYFIKFPALLILAAIFFTAGNFCFHGLFNSFLVPEEVSAVPLNKTEMKLDTCMETMAVFQEEKNSAANLSQEKTLLPCCNSNSHPSVIFTAPQTFEIAKVISTLFFNDYQLVKTILISAIYLKPEISPPELLALKSTIIRI